MVLVLASLEHMSYFLYILFLASQYLLSILGTNLIFGRGKILYFTHTGTAIFASYGLFITVSATGSYLLGSVVAIVLTSILLLVIAFLALRLDEDAFGIFSLALHFILLAIVLNWTSFTHGGFGITKIPLAGIFPSKFALVITCIFITVLWTYVIHRIDRSSVGRSLAALSENRSHAEALGIDRKKVYCLIFLLEGFGTFLANFFYFQYVGILHPNDFSFHTIVFILMIVVAGKPGSVLGAAVATFFLVFLKEGLRFLPLPLGVLGPVRLVLFGMILIVALYLRRNELFPRMRRV